FFAVILQGASEFRFHATAQAIGRYNRGGSAETQDPGAQFKFAADMHFHGNATAADLTHLLRGMPHTRADVFGDIGIEYDFDIERFFLDDPKRGLEVSLDSEVLRFVERLARLFDAFDPLDGEGSNLVVLLNECKQVQAAAKVHEAIRMDRVGLLLLA